MIRVRRRRKACDTELFAAASAPLNDRSRLVVRRSATTLGKRLSTTLIRHTISTPPRGPFTSRTRTVTRSTTSPYLPNVVRALRLISPRSSSSSETPSTLMLVGVIGTTGWRSGFFGNVFSLQSQPRLRILQERNQSQPAGSDETQAAKSGISASARRQPFQTRIGVFHRRRSSRQRCS